MTWLRKLSITVIVSVFIVGTAVLFHSDLRKRQSIGIVAKVEDYRRAHGEVPDSLTSIGIRETESGPIYYRKENRQDYIVWYGTTVGHSRVFNSRNRTWSEQN